MCAFVSVACSIAPAAAASPAEAVEDRRDAEELVAIERELQRARRGLEMQDAPGAYALRATLARATFLHARGAYGALVVSELDEDAAAEVEVRVGDATRDSTRMFGTRARGVVDIPLEADAYATARAIWSAVDDAYKGAVESLEARDVAESALNAPRTIPDWSAPPPSSGSVVTLLPCIRATRARQRAMAAGPMRGRAEQLVRTLSGQASRHPEVLAASVMFKAVVSMHIDLDTDGLLRCEPRASAVLAVLAQARAADGRRLDHADAIHLRAGEWEDAASWASLAREGDAMVTAALTGLAARTTHEVLADDYDGPVVFAPHAAAQLLASMVAPHASGTPAPLSEYGPVEELRPLWLDSVGARVLPVWLSLEDDPTRAEGFGSYGRDLEGVVASPLTLVRDGVLEALLMTRQPNAVFAGSNGRARGTVALSRETSISNLRLHAARDGLPLEALESLALSRADEDGYDYILVVERLRDPSLLGPALVDEATGYGTGRRVDLPAPAVLTKVYADGRRVPVRGALLSPASMRSLRRIRAVGNTAAPVRFRLAPGVSGGLNAALGVDAILSQTVDVQIETPALLMEGIELVPIRGAPSKAPRLRHPLR